MIWLSTQFSTANYEEKLLWKLLQSCDYFFYLIFHILCVQLFTLHIIRNVKKVKNKIIKPTWLYTKILKSKFSFWNAQFIFLFIQINKFQWIKIRFFPNDKYTNLLFIHFIKIVFTIYIYCKLRNLFLISK